LDPVPKGRVVSLVFQHDHQYVLERAAIAAVVRQDRLSWRQSEEHGPKGSREAEFGHKSPENFDS
jgi:hypothetical protein